MLVKIFIGFVLPVLVAHALPAKRDDCLTLSDSGNAASSLLQVVNSEISAAGPSGTAYTAYITTIADRPVVEVSSIGGSDVWVALTSGDSLASVPTPTPTPSASAPTGTAAVNAESTPSASVNATQSSSGSVDA
ncbi:hypothetical protein BD414DRAFT_386361, partial [Trametes punicea]